MRFIGSKSSRLRCVYSLSSYLNSSKLTQTALRFCFPGRSLLLVLCSVLLDVLWDWYSAVSLLFGLVAGDMCRIVVPRSSAADLVPLRLSLGAVYVRCDL